VSSPSPVRLERDGPVLTITLADQANRNALSRRSIAALTEAMARTEPGVRAVVVTNEGPVFCAGADLKERTSEATTLDPGAFGRLLQTIQRAPVPVIGRIAGHAVGGGMGLAAAFDIAVAADDVRFGFTEVRLGVAPAMISVVCLPKLRRADALEAYLRGHRFDANRAASIGLISRAVPRVDLDAEVGAILDDVLLGGPAALAAAKSLVNAVPSMNEEDAMCWTAELVGGLFASDEAAEGMAAFLERRSPSWATVRPEAPR
jgi:methylglutaconyl-CoA hydratase